LRKEIQKTEDLLAGVSDVKEQYRLTKKLNFLITKLNMARDTRVDLEVPQKYYGKLCERISGRNK